MPTVGEIVKKTTEFFLAKNDETSQSARLDSELLIGRALGLERLQVFLKHDQALNEEQLEKCRALVRRRSKGEPVAYILGEKGFYKHNFEVSSATLIPRPETEMLVTRALEILEPKLAPRGVRPKSPIQLEIAAAAARRDEADRTAALAEAAHLGIDKDEIANAEKANAFFDANNVPQDEMSLSVSIASVEVKRPRITIVDLGCGSGCIGLSVADEIKDRADVHLVFVDISSAAIEIAKRNTIKLGLLELSTFIVGDAGDDSVFAELNGSVDLVVANPPYIDPADTRVQEAVKLFEPHSALFAGEAGEEGVAEIRRWSIVAKLLASDSGYALFEIGDGQGPVAFDIFKRAGWDHVRLARDLSNRERMVEVANG